eukprot:1158786-Pelagomonas_calceolata.AAC.10
MRDLRKGRVAMHCKWQGGKVDASMARQDAASIMVTGARAVRSSLYLPVCYPTTHRWPLCGAVFSQGLFWEDELQEANGGWQGGSKWRNATPGPLWPGSSAARQLQDGPFGKNEFNEANAGWQGQASGRVAKWVLHRWDPRVLAEDHDETGSTSYSVAREMQAAGRQLECPGDQAVKDEIGIGIERHCGMRLELGLKLTAPVTG